MSTSLIWGTSFVILKNTLETVPVLYILALRFSGAALLMGLLGINQLKEIDRGYLRGGALMGTFLFLAYIFQTYGLVGTTPGKNAFLTSSYCIVVPFLNWLLSKTRPDKYNLSAALMCILGIGLVSVTDDLSIGMGDLLSALCGIFYALHMVATARYIENRQIPLLSFIQFAVVALLSWIFTLVTGITPAVPDSSSLLSIVYLCVMCTACTFYLQTYGQKHTNPSAAAVMLSLESVFGVIISILLYGERLSPRLIIGFILIFAAIIVSETKLEFLRMSS